jgi:hypothetical protein
VLSKMARWFRANIALALVIVLGLLVLCPAPAYAMHIAEGILPAGWDSFPGTQ